MQQLSKLQGTTSYFDENVGRVGVKSDTVVLLHYKLVRETKYCRAIAQNDAKMYYKRPKL